jgi:hypothetical protein
MPDDKSLVPSDLVEDYAEIGVEKLIDETKQFIPMLDDLSSEIPYIKTFVAAVKFPRTLSDFLLGKKVSAFLYSSGIDEAKLEKFKKKFSKSKQERLWERVVFSINAHDDKIKSEIVGKLFAALTEGTIDEDDFFDMVHATNALNLNTLEKLKQLYELTYDSSLPASLYYGFATLRLLDIDNSGIGTIGGGGPNYPLNQVGWKYIGIVYGNPPSGLTGVNIGNGSLISELNDEGQKTNKALPLDVIVKNGSRYQEVDIFMVNSAMEVLCNQEDSMPNRIGSAVVLAGETGNTRAELVAKSLGFSGAKPHGVLIRKMEETPVQKWAFAIKSDTAIEGTAFSSIAKVEEYITNSATKTDYTRYIMAVMEELDKPVNKLALGSK